MAELSPQAQAVRDAVLATYADSIPKDDNLWALERPSTVAALRAAAEQIDHDWSAFNCIDALNEIADELENHQ